MKTAQFKIGQIVTVGSLESARVLAKCAYPAGHAPAWVVEHDGILYEATDRRVVKISSDEAIRLGNPQSAARVKQDSRRAFESVFGSQIAGQFVGMFA